MDNKPVYVPNSSGRRDNIIGLVDDEKYSGKYPVNTEDYKCSECGGKILAGKYSTMYADDQGMLWCSSCAARCLEEQVRTTRKCKFDGPKLIMKNSRYCRRFIRGKKAASFR